MSLEPLPTGGFVPGQVFDRLTILGEVAKVGGHRRYACLCKCGTEKVIRGSHLRTGAVTSCGCRMGYRSTADARFRSRVEFGGSDECWLWQAGTIKAGYGTIRVDGLDMLAHRFAYEQSHGPIADGLQIHHRCSTRRCCNPGHMELLSCEDHTSLHNAMRGAA